MTRRPLVLAAVLVAYALSAGAAAAATAALPPIHHVYIVVEENESASTTFGPGSPAPYLSKTLRAQGAYLAHYYGVGHNSLDNYVAMISGQAPNATTQADCPLYMDFVPALPAGAYGQEPGDGCIYPASIPTIASQLSAAGLTWRDYNDGMGADPSRESSVCGHPKPGSEDHTQSATATDQYASRHNPFVYFHAIIDDTELCDTHVVNLDTLPQDLPTAPNYVFITPNLCDDGHDASCANGGPGGLPQADTFLRWWVPQITHSRPFLYDGGLLMIIFDEASTSDMSACCGEIPGPGSPDPGITGPGGGVVGAVLLSPFIKPGTVSQTPYNHYSMLRSVEDLFGLGHLGYAQLPGETSFGSDIFACAPARSPVAVRGRLPENSEFERARIVHHRKHVMLTLYSVGAAKLTVKIRARHRRTVTLKRQLMPCQTYSIGLPGAKGRNVSTAAAAYGGTQSATLHY